ncbi:MAG TPA: flagellar hook-associated protein FlgK [Fimbriimonadaceae bacterium]|jgi:flagellar hook-associated protein 1 FlgK
MPSLSSGYNIMNTALQGFQTALDVTGNNIANVNTAGYTRETVNFGESDPTTFYGTSPYQIGSGVTIQSISQIRSVLLDSSMNNAQSGLGQYQQLANSLSSVQGLFPEPNSGGISDALSGFFNAFSSLAASPSSASAQLAVQQAASTLTDRVQSTYAGLQQQAEQTSSQMTSTFNQIDQLTSSIASLNTQIATQTAEGGSPNSLLDTRAQDLQQLSGLVDIQTSTNPNGSVNVYTNGLNLVGVNGATKFPQTNTPGTLTFTSGSTSVSIQGGALAGLAQAASKISSYEGQLDTLANNLTTQVNAVYSTGKTAKGATGQDFFQASNPPGGAAGFQLTAAIAANSGAILSGTSGNAGDGAMAQSIANLNTTSISALGSQSFSTYYTNFIGGVGTDVQNATNSSSTQTAVVSQIQAQQQSISGVNIDEEMTNMLQYQHGYESAAKALSVIDTSTEDLIQSIQ